MKSYDHQAEEETVSSESVTDENTVSGGDVEVTSAPTPSDPLIDNANNSVDDKEEAGVVEVDSERSLTESEDTTLEEAGADPEQEEQQAIPSNDEAAWNSLLRNVVIGDEDAATPQSSRDRILTLISFVSVILLGAILRFWGLGDKPLHHDESLHAYYSLELMRNMQNWFGCFNAPATAGCYRYDPLLHGPFQFHAIAFVYQMSQWLGAPDHGINTTTVRIAAATLGTVIVGLPFFLRPYLGKIGAWLACFLLAVSPSLVYYSRFAREDIYMACFTMLLVVSAVCYARTRKGYWLVLAAAGFTLSYATKEATFLTIAVFGSFFVALLAWELGVPWSLPGRKKQVEAVTETAIASGKPWHRLLPRTYAPFVLLLYFVILGLFAKWLLGWLKDLSIYITASPQHTQLANTYVQGLKDRTMQIFPWAGIVLAVIVCGLLLREQFGKLPSPGRHGLARRVDPRRQPMLDMLITMPWEHWFFALMVGLCIFIFLFTVVFTNIRTGIVDGIWQGIYYWIQQQQVARGGQPWYYYFLLIPLYEQIGLIFALVGLVNCALHPTRFRLFLAYWFIGNVFIYSWAGEKMPWLVIHLTMPMMLLAAIGLEPAVRLVFRLIKERAIPVATPAGVRVSGSTDPAISPHATRRDKIAIGGAIFGVVMAVLLLIPTLQNMFQLNYVHYADAPHEMMIYVQTTSDIDIVMSKVDQLDQQLDQGRHTLAIGLTDDATWPYAWYLRDYTNVCFQFPTGCPAMANRVAVIITGGDNLASWQQQYNAGYRYHQYRLRTQWDQGYMPVRCIPTTKTPCAAQQYTGSGPLLWLSYGDRYGDVPPANVSFNLGKAVHNIWQWWWYRIPFGSTDGSYDMGFFVRKDLHVAP